MGAPSCVVFYGLRFDVVESELESLEDRSHPHIKAARRAGLKHYWANFASPAERYLQFVGEKIAILGPEDSSEVEMTEAEILELVTRVRRKLEDFSPGESPRLYLQWMNP